MKDISTEAIINYDETSMQDNRVNVSTVDSTGNNEISLDSDSSCDPENFADLQECENIETDRETDDILQTDKPEKTEINETTKAIKMNIKDIPKPIEPKSSESHTLLKSTIFLEKGDFALVSLIYENICGKSCSKKQ
ncbi:hypothetical protein JTB14_002153 [Gonioctena quinquepunctata]|nr:hypothetical protein JTB14_002153 [Gonioctena quinquepunctata]